jgi:hypothetical protein
MLEFIRKNKIHLIILAGLIALNFIFFAINLNNFFVSDDFDWVNISKNTHSLVDYFTGNYYGVRGEGGAYRPMVNLIFWINYQIGGLNPLPYHLTNLIFHIGVCFLIYLLCLLLFEDNNQEQKIAILAALFFSILPNHSEPVIWIAAVGDPVCSFFYLLAFYLYLLFRKKEKLYLMCLSALVFIFALLTKEMAVTLPLLILVWEFFEAKNNKTMRWKKIFFSTLTYWIILAAFFILRYLTIGLVLGYYAQEKFKFDLAQIFKMFVALIIDLFFYGRMRVSLTDFFTGCWFIYIFLLMVILLALWSLLKKYGPKILFLFTSYLILILPVLLLSFNNFNDEGERYNYLPSIIFCIILSLLVLQIKSDKLSKVIASGGLLVYFTIFLLNKNITWNLAAQLSDSIVKNEMPKLIELNKKEKVLFVSLPDNLDGAQVLRNGILQSINLFYPDNNVDAKLLNAYVRLTKQNYNQQILKWSTYPTGGYIAKTIDGKFWVTGFDRRETDDYVFELWGYNYSNYTSDTIRVILKKDIFKILIFDEGQLKILNK